MSRNLPRWSAGYRMIRVEWTHSGELEVEGVPVAGPVAQAAFPAAGARRPDSRLGGGRLRRCRCGGYLRLPAARLRGAFLLPGTIERLVAELGEGRPEHSVSCSRTGRTGRAAEPRGGSCGRRFWNAPAASRSAQPAEDLVGAVADRPFLPAAAVGAAARTAGCAAHDGFHRRFRSGVVVGFCRVRHPRAGLGGWGVRRAACGRDSPFGLGSARGMAPPFQTLLRY